MSVTAAHPITSVLTRVRAEGRRKLLETEGYAVAEALGFAVPEHVIVNGAEDVTADVVDQLSGARVVVKVLSPEIAHKTEVGGIRVTARAAAPIREAVTALEQRFTGWPIIGFAIVQHVPHAAWPGGELLLGMRATPDFGPVVTVGLGGVQTEFWAERLRREDGLVVLTPGFDTPDAIDERLAASAVGALATGRVRGGAVHLPGSQLSALVRQLLAFAGSSAAAEIDELEFNPVALTGHHAVVLDAVVRLAPATAPPPYPPRPVDKLRALLEPRSAAVMGVSEQRNPGRIIVENMLRSGFPADRLFIIKPDTHRLDGVRCYPSVAALPDRVDLLVVSVPATQVPSVVQDVVTHRKAESLIIIPGGLGERDGTEDRELRIRRSLANARQTEWEGPVLNGGNCLGIRSAPGRYDTTFIPEYKLAAAGSAPAPLALISQSGAFTVARASRYAGLDPRYVISVGNQTDLTAGDYLRYLADDPAVRVIGCYIEAFRPADGRRWLEAAARFVADGRHVVLYRAGRTRAGARATVSHTAAVAGDYAVARALAEAAGVLVADTLEEFDDLVALCCQLDGKQVAGLRLGAISNAGFECVAFADRLGAFTLAPLTTGTRERLRRTLADARLDGVVGVGNPLDLTPIMRDEGYEAAVRAVLDDDTVDVAIVGCVPLTPALQTLPAGAEHDEDLTADAGIVHRLERLFRTSDKAWVAVVDAGPLYDPMVARLRRLGVPTFRVADRALRLLGQYCRHRVAPSAPTQQVPDGSNWHGDR